MMIGTSGRAAFAFGKQFKATHPRHVDVGQNQDDPRVFCIGNALKSSGRRLGKVHGEATITQVAPELLAKQHLNVWLVIDHQNKQVHDCAPDVVNKCSCAR